MFDSVAQFKSLAAKANNAAAAAKDKSTLTNQVSLTALYIYMNGTLQEQVAIARLVSKGGELESHKGQVSKAKAVLEHLKEQPITTKDGAIVSLDVIKAGSVENLPDIKVSTLYNTIKGSNTKDETSDELALKLGAEAMGMTVKEIKSLLGNEGIEAAINKGKEIVSAKEAESMPDMVASIKANIASLPVAELESLIEYAMSLVPAKHVGNLAEVA